MRLAIALFAVMVFVVPATLLLVRRSHGTLSLTRTTILGLGVLDLFMALAVMGLATAWLFAPRFVAAAGLSQQATTRDPMAYIGAATAVAIGSLAAGYAVGAVGSAAVGTVAEKPEVFGRVLLFVGLAEGVAIYGLIIAFIILG